MILIDTLKSMPAKSPRNPVHEDEQEKLPAPLLRVIAGQAARIQAAYDEVKALRNASTQ